MAAELSSHLPVTEQENPRTADIAVLDALGIVRLMNEEDGRVAEAVKLVLPQVAEAVNGIVARLEGGGRLFYIGTGTSGRLGVLDASECPPTFGVSPELVQGIIAGGYDACHRAVEASEDDAQAGGRDFAARGGGERDALVGIAASGRTPYTVGAVEHARSLGAFTVALTCVPDSPITRVAEVSIVPLVGPEVIAGSTRLKAGTAQKMVLNMLSTGVMVLLGKTYGNLMVDLQPLNEKLRRRAVGILTSVTGMAAEEAREVIAAAGHDLKTALVMSLAGVTPDEARERLRASGGHVRAALVQT